MSTRKTYGLRPAGLALHHIRNGNADGANWVFFHSMDAMDREAFDAALVAVNHPLAHQPGTTETRFRAYVAELVKATS